MRSRATLALATLLLAGCARSTASTPVYSPPDPPRTFPATAECQVDPGVLPDPRCTPGSVDPAVIRDGPAFARTVCRNGSDAPPADYLAAVKRWQLLGDDSGRVVIARRLNVPANQVRVPVYGLYAAGSPSGYGVDLLVPTMLGGTDKPENLWVMPNAAMTGKVALETQARDWVCQAPPDERPGRLSEVQGMLVFNYHQLASLGSASG